MSSIFQSGPGAVVIEQEEYCVFLVEASIKRSGPIWPWQKKKPDGKDYTVKFAGRYKTRQAARDSIKANYEKGQTWIISPALIWAT